VVRDAHVDRRDAGDVDDDDLGATGLNRPEQLLRQLARPLGVEAPDDRKDEEAVANLQHGCGELTNRLLLLPNHALALRDEAHADGDCDPVRGRLVGIEDPVEQVRIVLVVDEERAGEDVTKQEHDPENLVRLDAARNDSLGEVARVRLQALDASGLERVDVVVVDGGHLREDLLGGHHAQELRVRDAPDPLLAKRGSVLAQVRDELRKERGVAPACRRRLLLYWNLSLVHCVLLRSGPRALVAGRGTNHITACGDGRPESGRRRRRAR
jgi:hypothetical protein